MKTLKLDLVSFLTLSALSAAAATHYVVPPGTPGVNPSGEFTSWATAATNIQAAVSIATNNSLVLVASGHYRLTNQIVIASAITLRSDKNGALDPAGTILDAQYPSYLNRCIYINNAAAVVEGFTLTNGYAAATDLTGLGGGAYLNLKGSVRNCVIAGNRAWKGGGGAYLHQGGVLSGCTVVGNVAMTNDIGYGGGAYVSVPHTIAGLITNCLFQGNSARRGGGVNLGNDNETLGGSTLVGRIHAGRDVPELPVHRQRQDLGAQHSRRRLRQLHSHRPFGGVRSGAASHGRKLHRLREYVELDTDRAGHQLGLAQLLHEAEARRPLRCGQHGLRPAFRQRRKRRLQSARQLALRQPGRLPDLDDRRPGFARPVPGDRNFRRHGGVRVPPDGHADAGAIGLNPCS